LFRFIIVRRIVIINSFKLPLQLSLSCLSCFDFGTLGCKSGFLLFGLGLGSLSSLLLFFFLHLASLHLFFESFETSLSSFTFLLKFGFLACGIVSVYC
jgi:hypothetical protein